MRLALEEAYDAPIDQDLDAAERESIKDAIVASNSITERGIDMHVGPLQEDLLAYELQVGNYYHRGRWMEDQVRHRELYRLATTDAELLSSRDAVPLAEWLS